MNSEHIARFVGADPDCKGCEPLRLCRLAYLAEETNGAIRLLMKTVGYTPQARGDPVLRTKMYIAFRLTQIAPSQQGQDRVESIILVSVNSLILGRIM